ncbi:MAG: ribosome assembly RNA-binding protein YhbY [Desulfuromonadales bacterium]|nr:ribosome assembly RNA-binding protein YhbY [Desulfuromonadales bacterium]
MEKLTGKQTRFLRGLGHHLDPVVRVGKEQLSERLLATTDEALTTHELIKVKLQEGCDLDRREVASQLATATGAAVVQILGKTFLLYRRSDQMKISLP